MKLLFDPDVYAARRHGFLAGLEDAVLVLPAAPERIRSRDTHYAYRASSDLVYLTGCTEPEACLVLRVGAEHPYALFVRPRDPEREQWEGERLGVEGAAAVLGADATFPYEELADKLPELIEGCSRLYYTLDQNPTLDRIVFDSLKTLRGGRGKPDRAPTAIIDPHQRLHDQRRVKEPGEIEIMRKAARLTADAHLEVMRRLQPGQHEYEIAAYLDFAFRRRGATGPGYETIVGGGRNAVCLHYTTNSDPLADGDLVLIDAGAELDFYNADITRTFPVGRRFEGFQRDLYQAVLEVQLEAIQKVRPGHSAHELTAWSRQRLTQSLVELGLLEGDPDALFEDKAYERFYMHGLGHYLGMDVHDVGTYLVAEDEPLPLEPGVVMTIEPGLYIPADAEDIPAERRGIGIRIEDDVLVTADGPEVLTGGVPKSIDEIEALRAEAY